MEQSRDQHGTIIDCRKGWYALQHLHHEYMELLSKIRGGITPYFHGIPFELQKYTHLTPLENITVRTPWDKRFHSFL